LVGFKTIETILKDFTDRIGALEHRFEDRSRSPGFRASKRSI